MLETKVLTRYIGITIGPIYDTLCLTSTPAGLWAASYMFSFISKSICAALTEKIAEQDIVSPFYKKDDALLNKNDGIGLFNDRIVFKAGKVTLEDVGEVVEEVKKEVANRFSNATDNKCIQYFKDFLQIYAIEFETDGDGNAILDSGVLLDGIELQKTFVQHEEKNYILSLFNHENGDESKSKNIKESLFVNELKTWQLIDSTNKDPKAKDYKIKDLESIACNGIEKSKQLKKHKYYAIVQSDGDNMSKVIGACKDDEAIRSFSKKCLKYSSEASQEIENYGGVTIYAGGDDLLFIAPVENNKKENIFKLLNTIEVKFSDEFGKTPGSPTLSFGVSISYVKFPLYESFSKAIYLLFEVAKKHSKEKNSVAVSVQKHSGQSFGFVFAKSNAGSGCAITGYDKFKEILKEISAEKDNGTKTNNNEAKDAEQRNEKLKEKDDILKSVATKLLTFEKLFVKAMDTKDETVLKNAFNNTFDSDIHKLTAKKKYINIICDMMNGINEGSYRIANLTAEGKIDTRIEMSTALIRMLKFFIEKKGKEGDDI